LITRNSVTAKELGRYLNLSESTIYELAAAGDLPGLKIGDSWRFEVKEILQLAKEAKKNSLNGVRSVRDVRIEGSEKLLGKQDLKGGMRKSII
jgi:excisionase family DNA binding protein